MPKYPHTCWNIAEHNAKYQEFSQSIEYFLIDYKKAFCIHCIIYFHNNDEQSDLRIQHRGLLK